VVWNSTSSLSFFPSAYYVSCTVTVTVALTEMVPVTTGVAVEAPAAGAKIGLTEERLRDRKPAFYFLVLPGRHRPLRWA
jgi:hypothetical protein